jgi:RNA polymerase sigma-70 factor, ECF subfamily
MPLDHLADGELAERLRQAPTPAEREPYIDELFRRNYARVARWCLRFASDRETAADLAQEVFARAYQNIASFQGQAKFSTWLFSIARNHCLNFVKAQTRQATELRAEGDEDLLLEVQDQGESPYRAAERASSAREVEKLLNESLDDTEKAVFTLHYAEDVSLDAITQILGLQNSSGAKAYIVSAKRKLARLIQRRGPQERTSR